MYQMHEVFISSYAVYLSTPKDLIMDGYNWTIRYTTVTDNIKKLEMIYSLTDDWLNKKWLLSHDKT